MATPAFAQEEERMESCIVVADRASFRPRDSHSQRASGASMKPSNRSQPAAVTKRPRGRPRKAKGNTADTAIVLSDSESERISRSRLNRKRPSSEVDPDELSPTTKRPATSASTPISGISSTRFELDQLHRQLACEKKLRADAERKEAELQAELDQREASWAADLAAHTTPLQNELQRLAKEKNDLIAEYEKVKARLRAASDGDKDHEVDVNIAERCMPDTVNSKDKIQDKNLLEARERLAEAERKILDLQRDLDASRSIRSKVEKDLVVSGEKRKEAEDKLREMVEKLAAEKKAREAAEDSLRTTREEITAVEIRRKEGEEKTLQQLTIMVNKRKQAEDKLKMKEQHLEETEKMLHRSKEIISRFERQQAAMVGEAQARLKQMATLESRVAALERENWQLSQGVSKKSPHHRKEPAHLAGENDALRRQLAAQEILLSKLPHEHNQGIPLPARASEGARTLKMQPGAQKGMMLAAASDNVGRQMTDQQHESNKGCENAAKSTEEELRCLGHQHAQGPHNVACAEPELRHRIAQLSRILEVRDNELLHLRQSLVKQTLGGDTSDRDDGQLRIRLLQVEEQLREKNNVVATQNLEAGKMRETISALRAGVTKLETELGSHRQGLQQCAAQLASKDEDIATKQGQITQLHRTISSLKKERTQLKDELSIQKRRVQQLGNPLAQHNNNESEALNTTFTKDNEETVASLHQQRFETGHEKDTLQHQIAAEASDVDTLRSQLADATATIERLTEAAATREAAIAALQADIRTVAAREGTANEVIVTLELENAGLQARLTATTSQTARLREEMAGLAESNAELQRDRRLGAAELEGLRSKLAELMAEGQVLEEHLAKRDGCLERMRELLRTMPQGMDGE
ncbi:uncharacterized protein P884DRAFT_194545 [Thermothelomyces heterothallicus CBS 202.75]|uniref:uncharacterized protein n=1 Tax=Thermothelomyces heterothallicus CBS 202.75 TaxID=1149848 RepID=UPI00374465EB